MAHTSTHRIYLRRGKQGTRLAEVIDSPYLPELACMHKIQNHRERHRRGSRVVGVARMTREGRKSEQTLLEAVKESPGQSIYELAGILNWTIRRVYGTAKRLLNSNKIYIRPIVKNGRRANLVYPEKAEQHTLNQLYALLAEEHFH